MLQLRLFVAGEAPNSVAAIENLRRLLAEHPEQRFSLEIVDVLESPERGLGEGILVTPTLLKLAPGPERRVIGNLRERSVLEAALGLGPRGTP